MGDDAFSSAERQAVYRAIAERRDVRRFEPGAHVSEAVLARLLQAAHAAPSVGLMQPWRFIRITDGELRRRIHGLVDEERHATAHALGSRGAEFLALKVEGILECAELFVVALCENRARHVFGRRTLPQMDLASASCAIENLWLAARVEGLGMGWVSIFDPDRLARLLGLPADADPVAILCLGPVPEFPDRPVLEIDGWALGRPLAEFVSENVWPRPRRSLTAVSHLTVDLNADLGEGFGVWQLGDDDAMLDLVTSANVACGFHAGDPAGLARTCRAAARRGVRIGAQVGYRDLAGFGRRYLDISQEDLTADVVYQIGALQALAVAAGSAVSYVKPHGALYNTIVTDRDQAIAVATAVHAVDAALPVLGLAGSAFFDAADRLGLRTVSEAFADRAYRPDGQLVSRREPDAVLHDATAIADRVASMIADGTVSAIDGSMIPVTVESVCVHGDSPGAVRIAAAVRDRLTADGVDLRAFV